MIPYLVVAVELGSLCALAAYCGWCAVMDHSLSELRKAIAAIPDRDVRLAIATAVAMRLEKENANGH